jgi:OPA family glycerol-3-phosphate transporter-like MFS transporter
VFYVPAGILAVWAVLDAWLIKDTPEDAGFPHLDTCDASSGQMHLELSVKDLLRRIFTSKLMLLIATVELTGGVFRYAMMNWYRIFAKEVPQPGAEFFSAHWGWYTCVFGIVGGFAGGLISDRMFQSRRGPPTALLCGFVLIISAVMSFVLFTQPKLVGWSAVFIIMASIGVTSLMSGTAATDFGGRKATATSMGIINGFAYVGSTIQSFSLGFLIPHEGWKWWPIFVIPFAVIGLICTIKIWHDLPEATRRYNQGKEDKSSPVLLVTE